MPSRFFPASVAATLWIIVTNLAIIAPVMFGGAPAGNPILLWMVELVLVSALTLVVVHRAERAGDADGLPSSGALGPTKYLAGFFLMAWTIGGFFVYAFAHSAGIRIGINSFWVPLALIVVRTTVEAMAALNKANSDVAGNVLVHTILRMVVLAAAVALAMGLFRGVLENLSPTEHPILILGIFVAVKILLEILITRHMTTIRAKSRRESDTPEPSDTGF